MSIVMSMNDITRVERYGIGLAGVVSVFVGASKVKRRIGDRQRFVRDIARPLDAERHAAICLGNFLVLIAEDGSKHFARSWARQA